MRDPIEDLQHFRSEGTTVNPLPASEVRRRGDRMRRRNTALATVGGVAAAIVAVGVPVGLVQAGSSGDGREISPAPPSVTWLQEVPESFPLDAGYGPGSATDEVAPSIPDTCGTPFWTTDGTTDVAGATVSGGEAFDARTLMVYPDADAAERALAGIRAAVADCPEQTEPDEGPDTTLVHEVLDQDLPTEESFVFVQRARFDDGLVSDATITGIGRSGNALLVDQSYSSAGDDRAVASNLRLQLQRAATPYASMCVFSATPCAAPDEDPAARIVPDGFPLLDGVPDDPAATITGPGRGLQPIVLEECDARVEVPDHTDLVRADWSAPGDERRRQLVTFADEDRAQAYVDAVLELYEGCIESTEPDGTTQYVQALGAMSGYDAAGGAHISWERDGEGEPGFETVAVVRDGAAVLVSTVAGDEGVGPDGGRIQQQTQDAFTSVDGVVRAMRDL